MSTSEIDTEHARVARRTARLMRRVYEEHFPRWDVRRYGQPWGAVVSLRDGALHYDFRAAVVGAVHGRDGLVLVPCVPGMVVATGQKNLREPDKSQHTFRTMKPDGSCPVIDRAEALRILEARPIRWGMFWDGLLGTACRGLLGKPEIIGQGTIPEDVIEAPTAAEARRRYCERDYVRERIRNHGTFSVREVPTP